MLKRCTLLIGAVSMALLLSTTFEARQGPGGGSSSQGPQGGQAGGGRGAAQAPQGPPPPIEQRTGGMQKIDGYFPLYWDERTGSMFMEISRLDADFLFVTGLSAGLGSNDIGLDRGAGGEQKEEGGDGAGHPFEYITWRRSAQPSVTIVFTKK